MTFQFEYYSHSFLLLLPCAIIAELDQQHLTLLLFENSKSSYSWQLNDSFFQMIKYRMNHQTFKVPTEKKQQKKKRNARGL